MSKRSISDRLLRRAAKQVSESMLFSMPPPSACNHEFSERFETAMASLLDIAHRKESRILIVRRVAAALLALLIGVSAILALNPTTRAVITRWLRETFENQIVYRFAGEDVEMPLPEFEIGWIPEGYEQETTCRDSVLGNMVFYNAQHDLLTVTYTQMTDSVVHSVMFDHPERVVTKNVQIHRCPGDLYLVVDGSECNVLVWSDEGSNIQITIYGFLSEKEMIKMAESIKYN